MGIIIDMDITLKLQDDLHQAMKTRDDAGKRVVRMLLAGLKLAEVAKGAALDQTEFLALVQKEIKIRNEAMADASKAHRADLIAENQAELERLFTYLPKQLTEAELLEKARAAIAETDAKSVKDMGRVLKLLLPNLAGQASNADASRAVKSCLEAMEQDGQ